MPIKQNNMESRPNPDPSVLTTDQILRENQSLKELLSVRLDGVSNAISQRLDGMDKALELLQSRADKVPSETDIAVENLRKLHDEKFSSISIQFKERDTRTEQASKDSKVAIDAALSAQKESVDKQNISNSLAIAKSETGFTKQIDLIGENFKTMTKSFDDKINDMKDRITTIETQKSTISAGRHDTSNFAGLIISGVVGLVVVLTAVVGVVVFVVARN